MMRPSSFFKARSSCPGSDSPPRSAASVSPSSAHAHTVMIETLEGVAMAEEIAATHGVDVVILGNNDLSSFSGWGQNDPRYQDALITVRNAALKYGKYFGNAGAQYLKGYVLSADTRMVQNGHARHGYTAPRGGGP